MKVFKKFIAVLCSATMIVAAPLTAFATEGAPSSTGGAGNILAYSYDTVTVPTSIKITFNPQKLDVRTGGTDDSPVTSDEQIVSLNYGIANKATDDKKIIVGFVASATAGTGTAVTFVDEATKAEPKTDSNESGAVSGELKMYLAVASASAVPKTNADAAFEVTDVTDGKNTENASASELANVKMTPATVGNVAFAKGTNNYAFANIGYSLGKATYTLQESGSVGFETEQSEVKEKLEMETLGDVDGFTFVGKMNPNANWTTANIAALTITPVYTITDADGTETEAASGVYKQITLTAEEKAAEPAKPLTATEVAVSAFKTTHADVVTLLADLTAVDGSAEEMTKIEAAITDFEALDETADAEVIAALAANDPSITAETLAALKTASEAAAVPDVTEVTGSYDSNNSQYRINLAAAVSDVSDITNFKVDGNTVTITGLNGNKDTIKVDRSAVKSAMGASWDSATEFTFTFTVDGVNYTCTIGRNG